MEREVSLAGRTTALARRYWLVWSIGLLVFANGSLEILTGLRPGYHSGQRLAAALPFGLKEWNRSAAVVLGLTLVFFSLHLVRRKRLAWWLTLVALVVLAVVHLAGWRHAYLAFGSCFLLALLLLARRYYTVKSGSRGIVRGAESMVAILFVAVLWGTVAFYLLDEREFGREFGFGEAMLRTLREFVLVGNPDLVPLTEGAVWFPRILGILGVSAEFFALFSFFRPVAYRLHTAPEERRRAQALIDRYGRSAYDYFKAWPDKSLFFATPRTFVGYTVNHGVAVALGDPTGPPDELDAAILAFIRFATDNGWAAAFLMPEDVSVYRALNLWAVKIGEEATVDLHRFGEVTARNKYFRRAARHMEEEGAHFERHLAPHPKQLLDEVEGLSAAWMGQEHYREFGFVQGTMGRGYLQRTVLDVLRDAQGRLIAFVNEVPSYRPGEMGFDMMRRLPDAPGYAMDYLFLQIMLALEEQGYRIFNFGLAPFAGVGEDPDANLVEKTIRGVAPYAQRLVRSEGLTQYKRKFEPQWEDRHVVYQGGPLALPQVALAVSTVA